MRTTLFTVEDAFDIENRGVVVVGHVPNEWFADRNVHLAAGDDATIVLPDGSEHAVNIRGVDWIRPPLGTPYGEEPKLRGLAVLIGGIESKLQAPAGSTLFRDAAGA